MARYFHLTLVLLFLFSSLLLQSQNIKEEGKLGLPGDNLNLYAALKLFQESATLEEFEKKLNEEDNRINNLDLDGNGETDYIAVFDEVDGSVHNIILRISLGEKESQDVAVFTVEKLANGGVQIQVTGDEQLYGKDYIIEPNMAESNARPNPGYTGTTQKIDDKIIVANTVTRNEIAAWPVVQVIYAPSYVVWHSPWYWGHYPGWWSPWRPWYWHQYYGYHYNGYYYYYGWYRRAHYHYYPGWNGFYYSNRRTFSVTVVNRRRSGYYSVTYSRPELRRDGMNYYTQRHPERPVLKPGLNRPSRPTQPIARPNPGRPNPTRPVTRPNPTRPVTRPNPTNPATRPAVRPNPTRPVTKPATRPAAKPAARPARSNN